MGYLRELSEQVYRGGVLTEGEIDDLLEMAGELEGNVEYAAYETVLGNYENKDELVPTDLLDIFEAVEYARKEGRTELEERADQVIEPFEDIIMRDYDMFDEDITVEEIRELYRRELEDIGADEDGMMMKGDEKRRSLTLTTFLLEARKHIV